MHSMTRLIHQAEQRPFIPFSDADAEDLMWWLGYAMAAIPRTNTVVRSLIYSDPVIHFPDGPHLTLPALYQWLMTHNTTSPAIAILQPILAPLLAEVIDQDAQRLDLSPAEDEEPILDSDKLLAAFWSGYGYAI